MKNTDMALLVVLTGNLNLMTTLYNNYGSKLYKYLAIVDIVLVIVEMGRIIYGNKSKSSKEV